MTRWTAGIVVLVALCQGGACKPSAMKKEKRVEAEVNLKKIYEGARSYYLEESIGRGAVAPVPPQFPDSIGMTPPAGSCCGRTGNKCSADHTLWLVPSWEALKFSVDDPHYYSYEFVSGPAGFTVRAVGDLDCDGQFSTFEMSGTVGPEGDVGGPAGIRKMQATE